MLTWEAQAELRRVATCPGPLVVPDYLRDRLYLYFAVYMRGDLGECYLRLKPGDARTFLLILAELIEV